MPGGVAKRKACRNFFAAIAYGVPVPFFQLNISTKREAVTFLEISPEYDELTGGFLANSAQMFGQSAVVFQVDRDSGILN